MPEQIQFDEDISSAASGSGYGSFGFLFDIVNGFLKSMP
jgi:hypothetical protein